MGLFRRTLSSGPQHEMRPIRPRGDDEYLGEGRDGGGNDDYEKDFRGSSGEGRRGQGRTTGTGPISIRREEHEGFPFRQPNDDDRKSYESTHGPP